MTASDRNCALENNPVLIRGEEWKQNFVCAIFLLGMWLAQMESAKVSSIAMLSGGLGKGQIGLMRNPRLLV
jgi:hypothetical protein